MQQPGPPSVTVEGDALDVSFDNNHADMQRAIDGVDEAIESRPMTAKRKYAIRLALDELLSNVVKYAHDDGQTHRIEARLEMGVPCELTIRDDGRPFNPLEDAPPPVLDGPIEERPIGGLGLHMIVSMGMKLDYRRENGHNVLRVAFPEE